MTPELIDRVEDALLSYRSMLIELSKRGATEVDPLSEDVTDILETLKEVRNAQQN